MMLEGRPARAVSLKRRSWSDAALDCGMTGTLLGHKMEGMLATIVTTSDAIWMLLAAGWTRGSKPDGRPVRKATIRDQVTTAFTTNHHLTSTLPSRDPQFHSIRARLVKHTIPVHSSPLYARRKNHYTSPVIAQNQPPHDQARSPPTQPTTRRHRRNHHSLRKLQNYRQRQQWNPKNASPSAQPPISRMALRYGPSSCLLCCARSSSALRHQIRARASRCAGFSAGHPLTTRCSSAVS